MYLRNRKKNFTFSFELMNNLQIVLKNLLLKKPIFRH